jgi:hypothetical protein
LANLKMPDVNGITVLREVKGKGLPYADGDDDRYASTQTVVEAMKLGACGSAHRAGAAWVTRRPAPETPGHEGARTSLRAPQPDRVAAVSATAR